MPCARAIEPRTSCPLIRPGRVRDWLVADEPHRQSGSTLDVVVTPPRETTANQVTTRVGVDGRIEIRDAVHTDVVIDVIGYYTFP